MNLLKLRTYVCIILSCFCYQMWKIRGMVAWLIINFPSCFWQKFCVGLGVKMLEFSVLTHFMSLVSFNNPSLKISANLWLSVFRWYRKRPLTWNGPIDLGIKLALSLGVLLLKAKAHIWLIFVANLENYSRYLGFYISLLRSI